MAFFRSGLVSIFWIWCFTYLTSSCGKKNEDVVVPPPTPKKPDYPYYLSGFYSEPADNPSTTEGIALGKALFFETALSRNNTISCATCHQPELAFTDARPIAVGIEGRKGTRNTPGILNSGLQQKYFWDGRSPSLEEQSLHPIRDPREMDMNLTELPSRISALPQMPNLFLKAFGSKEVTLDRIAKALAQFERSLLATNSKYDRFLKGLYTPNAEEKKGMDLFFTHPDPFAGLQGIRGGNCGDCHLSQTLMGRQDGLFGFHNNGLATGANPDSGLQSVTRNPADFGKFKAPPLRNVALTAPYMHDGRFQTLEEVLDHYNAEDLFLRPNVDILIQQGTNERFGQSLLLRPDEKKAIIAFLHMLTDSSYSRGH